MLSPDPYVADPTYSQDYNRYIYARNNPFSYTDPTGEGILDWLKELFRKKNDADYKAADYSAADGGAGGNYDCFNIGAGGSSGGGTTGNTGTGSSGFGVSSDEKTLIGENYFLIKEVDVIVRRPNYSWLYNMWFGNNRFYGTPNNYGGTPQGGGMPKNPGVPPQPVTLPPQVTPPQRLSGTDMVRIVLLKEQQQIIKQQIALQKEILLRKEVLLNEHRRFIEQSKVVNMRILLRSLLSLFPYMTLDDFNNNVIDNLIPENMLYDIDREYDAKEKEIYKKYEKY